MNRIKILIVEDELIVADNMSDRLTMLGYDICEIADNFSDALRLFAEHKPDMVLMDINIRGEKDGIDTAIEMQKLRPFPLIFLTSLSDRITTTRARAAHPSAYIVKPFNDYELNLAIELAIDNFSQNIEQESETRPESFPPDTHYLIKDSVFVKVKGKFEKIMLDDILWIEADGNYSVIGTLAKNFTVISQLGALSQKISNPLLARVHKSYVVNIHKIDSFDDTRLFINNKEIPISQGNRDEFFKRFNVV